MRKEASRKLRKAAKVNKTDISIPYNEVFRKKIKIGFPLKELFSTNEYSPFV